MKNEINIIYQKAMACCALLNGMEKGKMNMERWTGVAVDLPGFHTPLKYWIDISVPPWI